MAPINKSISFSGIKNLKLALHAEVDNFHQDILSLTFIDDNTKKDKGNSFKLVFKFETSSNLVKRWFCHEEFHKEPNLKETSILDKRVKPTTLETLYEKNISEIEKAYLQWLEVK